MATRRRSLAVVSSAALHGALALFLLRSAASDAPARPASADAVELELISAPAPKPPAAVPPASATPSSPGPRTPASAPPPARGPRRRGGPAAASPPATAPTRGGERTPRSEVEPIPVVPGTGAAPPSRTAPDDTPRALVLSPSSDAWPVAPADERILGKTVRNEPGASGSASAEEKAAEAARVGERVEGWLKDDIARGRVENGVVDEYFGRMRLALEKKLDQPDLQVHSGLAEQLAASFADAARTYGATGNPYADMSAARPVPPVESALERQARASPGSPMARLNDSLEQAANLREFADGRFGAGLVAIVELRQGGNGKLVEAKLINPSGNGLYDAHVLRAAPEALELLPPPPALGAGIHPEGLRSHWAFEGRVRYKRRLKDLDPVRDAWYLAAMGFAGMLTGNGAFSTGTYDLDGNIEIIDLRNPQFTFKARLLRVY